VLTKTANNTVVSFIVVIPARLKSTRLPDKPLADIAGKPMVVRVAERAGLSEASAVYVATDDAAIVSACETHGHTARLTRVDHASGTDRIAEVAAQLQLADEAIVVNVQGDEPLIDPKLINAVAASLQRTASAPIATAAHRITTVDDFSNPNVVKVVVDANGLAQYFSRAPIPYPRTSAAGNVISAVPPTARRHIGIYAYRVRFLRQYATLSPAPNEIAEALEQLRALHHGHQIVVIDWDGVAAPGVDTAEDLAQVRAAWPPQA
jgi:3-deoxy-manno-octulosonate cytidylyltransferase (CMP-KDO synthetase)